MTPAALLLAARMVAAGLALPGTHLAQEAPPAAPPAEADNPPGAPTDPGDTAAEPSDPEELDPDGMQGAVVYLTNGQKISGRLVENDQDHVVVLVGNIRLDLPKAQVERVELQPSLVQQYESMRRMISPKDLPQRILLAQWLFDKEKYDWALKEVDGVLDEDSANPEALRLRRLILAQLDLRARAGQPKAPPRAPVDKPAKFQFPLLTPEQINLIKIYEVDLADPPRLVIPREAIDLLLKQYAGSELLPPTKEGRDALYHRSPAEILELMFRLHARELYGMVRVLEQPRSMLRFRDDVQQAWLMNSCATDRCHGGADAGRLRLYNRRPNSDATAYTDFLILDRFRLAEDRPLIDYEEPAHSPLLQLAIPRENSLYPHPPVPGANGRGDVWKPALASTADPRFGRALDWIKAMYKPRPEYPVTYEPPGSLLPRADATTPVEPR
jgi:hypothetical protein